MSIDIKMPSPHISLKFGEFRSKYESLNNKGGVYFLYNIDSELLYVGKSINLYARINQHLNGHGKSKYFAEFIYRIDIVFESNSLHREIYETFAINELRPPHNTSKLFKDKKTDREYELETNIDELVAKREFMRHEIYRLAGNFDNMAFYDLEDDLTQEESEDWGELALLRRQYRQINVKITELRQGLPSK